MPVEVPVSIVQLSNDDSGREYELRINLSDTVGKEERSANEYEWDRFIIGRFRVESDRISMVDSYSVRGLFHGEKVIVCQEDDHADVLEKNEEGIHYMIEVKGDECMFNTYEVWGDTTYYELQLWKKGKGLVYYKSGWGGREKPYRNHSKRL